MSRVEAVANEKRAADAPAPPECLETKTWPCPGLSPHPPHRTDSPKTLLEWTTDKPSRYRILDYTCSCGAVVYELLACGGNYRIRRTNQALSPGETYAGPWRRQVAERTWALILSGEASLCSCLTSEASSKAGERHHAPFGIRRATPLRGTYGRSGRFDEALQPVTEHLMGGVEA
ncbi:hypothetical protein ACGFNP_34100 [Nonomuraea sp. NPDC049269]|uniref:hypothetical protein n=1 Tax=Nonomuraea sp. NPDC049269 TaxID=3364349 RepID=UPI0037175DF6